MKINKAEKKKKGQSPTIFLTKNRKGELTTQQLVMLIILILSFAVILFFIFRLNLGGTTNKEICHDSVVKKNQVLFLENYLESSIARQIMSVFPGEENAAK